MIKTKYTLFNIFLTTGRNDYLKFVANYYR